MAVKFKDRNYIGIYHNPETGLFARQTVKNFRNGHLFAWREEKKLPQRFLPKIVMLNLAGVDKPVEGIGRLRKSYRHRGLFVYYLYHKTWSKE